MNKDYHHTLMIKQKGGVNTIHHLKVDVFDILIRRTGRRSFEKIVPLGKWIWC